MRELSPSRPRRPPALARTGAVVHDAVRARLWPLPITAVVVAAAAGVAVPLLDAAVDDVLPTWVTGLVFGGGPSAARDVLAAIAGAIMTVTSLTFSLTVVTLQLASSQFSPRLLRTFTADGVVQGVLGLFLGTFTYALIVLRTVRDTSSGEDGGGTWGSGNVFVPRIAVTLAVVLAVTGVIGLIGFLAHLTRQIRLEPVLQAVHQEGTATLSRLDTGGAVPAGGAWGSAGGLAVPARRTGFVTGVDTAALRRFARRHEVVVDVSAAPGTFVLLGAPVARIRPAVGGGDVAAVDRDALDAAARAVRTGTERTTAQDPTFPLQQLLDVVMRALSPGTNDPTSAVHGLGHVSALARELLDHGLGDEVWREDDGRMGVVVRRPGLVALMDAVIGQPLRYATQDASICCELLLVLARLAVGRSGDAALVAELRRRREQVLARVLPDADEADARMLLEAGRALDAALVGTWDQGPFRG